jgi:DNA repair protein RecO (recombination protein O)
VSWDAICRLSALVDGDWGELDGVSAAASIQRETHQIVEEWGEYYLERPIRSMRLLD